MSRRQWTTTCALALLVSLPPAAHCSEPAIAKDTSKPQKTANSPQLAPHSPSAPASAERACYALLIGCTTYDHRPDIRPLVGPANDVQLMHDLLQQQFGFPESSIVVLSEKRGGTHRPVRANIVREFKALSQRAQKDDQVVILMSGHGSQQPDDGDPAKSNELDGLNEIFLPADIGSREETTKFVPNAIVDDELGEWVAAIASTGARVFVIVDACHSGTMLRGDVEVSRDVPPEQLISAKALEAGRERAQQLQRSRGTVREETMLDRRRSPPGLVALYAAKADETAPERPMPLGDANAKPYGVLTFTLCKLLAESQQNATPLTYRELGQRLQAQYLAWGRLNGPTPFAEGSPLDLDREVLGAVVHTGRSRIVLTRNQDGLWAINVGRLHGITHRSVLAVYPPKGDKPLGHVIVTESGVIDSIVEPVSYGGLPKPTVIPKNARCSISECDLGDLRISVAVDKGSPEPRRADSRAASLRPAASKTDRLSGPQSERLTKLEDDLRARGKETNALFKLTPKLAEARWVVQVRKAGLYLLPADAAQLPESAALRPGTPLYPLPDDGPIDELVARLQRIGQAQNLIQIADESRKNTAAFASSAQGPSDVDSEAPRIQVEMIKCASAADPVGEVIPQEGKEVTLRRGDYIAFRVTNTGRVPVEFTLLFVDSEFAIKALFPRGGADNRLESNGRPFQTRSFRVNDKTMGHEQLVAIGIRSEKGQPPVDFTFLAQPNAGEAKRSIESTRGGDGLRSFESPLGQLLRHAMFRDGATRSIDDATVGRHDVQRVSWNVVNAP